MGSESAASMPWSTAEDACLGGCTMVTREREFAFPWAHFLYAHGDDEEVLAFWTTHEIVIRGRGLRPLVADFASQRLTALVEAPRSARFTSLVPVVAEINITRIEED